MKRRHSKSGGGKRASRRKSEAAPASGTPVDIWMPLRKLTAARIGLPRSGASLATRPLLDLRLAHARARDAVHATANERELSDALRAFGLPVVAVSSMAADRSQYLMRPDLGRRLLPADATSLEVHATDRTDVVFVITEGLSARALAHAKPLLAEVLPVLARETWRIAPLIIVRLGRVAAGDVVAAGLNADICVVLIGERPGLSAPDSMGAYLTWRPDAQTSDAQRNCISNIRPEGIAYADAAFKLLHLLRAMRTQKMSGVALKDTTDRLLISDQ